MFSKSVFVLMGLAGAVAHADSMSVQEKYFTIGSVQVEELNQPDVHTMSIAPSSEALDDCAASQKPNVNGGNLKPNFEGIDLDQIISIGKKVWTIIEKNQPSVNLKLQKVDAIPLGIKDWSELECWQVPESKIYQMNYKNLYGINVVTVKLRVNYTHGGRVNGQGQFLSQVTILPAQVDVVWGFTLNGEVRVANVTNAGTRSNPVAAVQLDVNWSVKTYVKYSETTESFYVRGDGFYKHLD